MFGILIPYKETPSLAIENVIIDMPIDDQNLFIIVEYKW